MFPLLNTKDPAAVESEVLEIYRAIFPKADAGIVSKAFGWMLICFAGQYRDYLPIDARYHDREHTLQGTLCLMRLLQGRHLAGAKPPIGRELFELGLISILLHDTGYLKQKDDTEGTGAKYTLTHVNRSAEFAAILLAENGYGPPAIRAVQNMILCTGVNTDLKTIPFQSESERITGFALATADLLGQMAAEDYLEKLPILYLEFDECQRYHDGHVPPRLKFASAQDLLRMTPFFWEKYVQRKIADDFLGLYHYLSRPVPDGSNFYIERIEKNIKRLKRQLKREEAASGVASA